MKAPKRIMLPTRKAQPIARNAAWLSSHGSPNSNVLTIPVPCTPVSRYCSALGPCFRAPGETRTIVTLNHDEVLRVRDGRRGSVPVPVAPSPRKGETHESQRAGSDPAGLVRKDGIVPGLCSCCRRPGFSSSLAALLLLLLLGCTRSALVGSSRPGIYEGGFVVAVGGALGCVVAVSVREWSRSAPVRDDVVFERCEGWILPIEAHGGSWWLCSAGRSLGRRRGVAGVMQMKAGESSGCVRALERGMRLAGSPRPGLRTGLRVRQLTRTDKTL